MPTDVANSIGLRKLLGIATAVCALPRNDRKIFKNKNNSY